MAKRRIHVLLVVDGYFSLGERDINDRSFSISWLISVLKKHPDISLETAHRDGDHSATIWGKFDFANTLPDLGRFDEIWLLGFNGPIFDPNPFSKDSFKGPLSEEELLVLATFMENGGGVLATGDHGGVGSYMCGRIPRMS
jgi:hypothetical protein